MAIKPHTNGQNNHTLITIKDQSMSYKISRRQEITEVSQVTNRDTSVIFYWQTAIHKEIKTTKKHKEITFFIHHKPINQEANYG